MRVLRTFDDLRSARMKRSSFIRLQKQATKLYDRRVRLGSEFSAHDERKLRIKECKMRFYEACQMARQFDSLKTQVVSLSIAG